MRHALNGLSVVAALVCAGAFAVAAWAAPNGIITPYIQCADGSETIPALQEIGIRSSWVTANQGQAAKFIAAQKIEWTIYGMGILDPGVLASSGPQAFGSTAYWSGPFETSRSLSGTQRKVVAWDYGVGTGFRLAAGESVRLVYSFEVNKQINDGLGELTPAGVIFSTQSCIITAD
jgi:hypothetical protein